MARGLAIASAVVVVLAGVAAVSAPTLMRFVAESKIDAALARMRVQTTSVVNRGEVSVDLWSWTVSVRDIAIEGANETSRVGIGRLTIVSPATDGDLLVADRLIVEDVTVKSAGETIVAPHVEFDGYSGPESGLTATPGIGRNARTQADLIGRVSVRGMRAPIITVTGDESGIRRTIRNARMSDVVNGVVGSAAFGDVSIEALDLPPDKTSETSAISITARSVAYEGVNLPALWRFFAGDGSGYREQFLKTVLVDTIDAMLTRRSGGAFKAAMASLRVDGVQLRALAYPVTAFDPIVAKIRLGDPVTPAEIRQQLQLAVDAARAVSFERIAVGAAEIQMLPQTVARLASNVSEEPQSLAGWTAGLASAEIVDYADGRIERLAADGVNYRDTDAGRISLQRAEATTFDATQLLAYVDRVGRDEILLTTRPTAEEVVKIAPRVARLDAKALNAASGRGELSVQAARIDVDAPLDAVPQRFAFRLDGLDARPAEGTAFRAFLAPARLETLEGSAAFTLTLDPNDNSLRLEGLDYRLEQLGTVKGAGELASVDPTLAFASGAALFDKFTAIVLGSFKFTAKDDGAVALLLARGAEAAGESQDEYRERLAREAQETIARLFGPPAEKSAQAAAEFIREPRAVEVTLNPRNADQTLLNLIRAFDLGPAGVAQVIDVDILYRR